MEPSRIVRFEPAADRGLLLRFDVEHAGPPVRRLVERWLVRRPAGVVDLDPAAGSLLVGFDPPRLDHRTGEAHGRAALAAASPSAPRRSREIEIPTCYEPPFAVDLRAVATMCGMTEGEVVAAHSGAVYEVDFF